jgi:hypothetical protein
MTRTFRFTMMTVLDLGVLAWGGWLMRVCVLPKVVS